MKHRHLFIFLFFLCLGTATAAAADDVTIKGEVVDLVSYMVSGTKADSPQGIEIVKASAVGGNPLGILEDGTGRLYVVTIKQANTGANATLTPWIGSKITAKGQLYTRGGARVLILTTVGKAMN
jgi:hypothetical protein